MTDYQKYINALRKCAKEHENDRTSTGHIIVSDLCQETANLLEELSSSENPNKWIPVSERLPLLGSCKRSDDVLITDGDEIDMGFIVEKTGKIFWHYYGSEFEVGVYDEDNEDNDAIAWMPLPKPYEPQESEDAISRKEVIDTIYRECSGVNLDIDFAKVLLLQRKIKALQSVRPKQKTGEWINGDCEGGNCNICGKYYAFYPESGGFNYCPNCGAKMESEEKE